MKKFFFFAFAALGMMASCQKQGTTTVVEDNAPVAVSFGIDAPIATVSAKAAVDAWSGAEALYVYGFPTACEDFSAEGAAFINNTPVNSPAEGVEGNVIPTNAGVPYYYAADNTTYDFYGYYVGTATVEEPVMTATSVSVNVTIDGSQDIMLAKADQATDVAETEIAAYPERAYSAYSARKGIKPTLKFYHQLARFEFKVVAGAESAVAGNETAVSVTGISILDTQNAGTLTVVGENRAFVGTGEANATLALAGIAEGGVAPATVKGAEGESTLVGESLMVVPGATSYKMQYVLAQNGVNAAPAEITLDINKFGDDAVAAGAFLAGYKYVVTLTVYSLEQVEITAKLEPWTDGGSFGYDPDEDWE